MYISSFVQLFKFNSFLTGRSGQPLSAATCNTFNNSVLPSLDFCNNNRLDRAGKYSVLNLRANLMFTNGQTIQNSILHLNKYLNKVIICLYWMNRAVSLNRQCVDNKWAPRLNLLWHPLCFIIEFLDTYGGRTIWVCCVFLELFIIRIVLFFAFTTLF